MQTVTNIDSNWQLTAVVTRTYLWQEHNLMTTWPHLRHQWAQDWVDHHIPISSPLTNWINYLLPGDQFLPMDQNTNWLMNECHCALAPSISGIYKGLSTGLQWGNWAPNVFQLQAAVASRRKRIFFNLFFSILNMYVSQRLNRPFDKIAVLQPHIYNGLIV